LRHRSDPLSRSSCDLPIRSPAGVSSTSSEGRSVGLCKRPTSLVFHLEYSGVFRGLVIGLVRLGLGYISSYFVCTILTRLQGAQVVLRPNARYITATPIYFTRSARKGAPPNTNTHVSSGSSMACDGSVTRIKATVLHYCIA
jgi:hypothetical protein